MSGPMPTPTSTLSEDEKRIPALRRSRRRKLPAPFLLLNIPKTGTEYISRLVRSADWISIAGAVRKFAVGRILLRSDRLRSFARKKFITKLGRSRRRPLLRFGYMNSWEHHIFYCRLPESLHSCPAVSVLREPLSWYISHYLHVTAPERTGFLPYLRKNLQGLGATLDQPRSPRHQAAVLLVEQHLDGKLTPQAWQALSFEGFCCFVQHFHSFNIISANFSVNFPPSFPLGPLGCRAMMFVHRDPKRLFAMPPEKVEAYFTDGRWRRDLAPVRFLRFEKLQEDLYSVMLEHLGYERETLDTAAQLTPAQVNVSDPVRKERALRELEQKPQLREEILRNERLYVEHLLPLAGNFRND